MIKCLIFDLDDTLYYEKSYVLGAFKDVCTYLGQKYCVDFKVLYNRCIAILDKYGRGKIFNILCDEFNFKEDISYLVGIYRKSKPDLELYRESNEIIKFAKMNNLYLGLITDGCSQVQWNKIKALGLETKIDKIIVTDDYGQGYGKPHNKSYKDIISYFNVKPCECMYIGDNPKKDFIGAKKLGMKTVRIIYEKGDHIHDEVSVEYEADYIIRSLLDIEVMIELNN